MVKIPMMPKGVEHSQSLVKNEAPPRMVKIPMMPKGVEHYRPAVEPYQQDYA